jgi:hypothetical protein
MSDESKKKSNYGELWNPSTVVTIATVEKEREKET